MALNLDVELVLVDVKVDIEQFREALERFLLDSAAGTAYEIRVVQS